MTDGEPALVSLTEIRAASRWLEPVAVRTPLIPFPGPRPRLLVKPESLQPTGSFKLRGAYNAIMANESAARQYGVVAHSSGNHGYAVAYAAALLGVHAVVVVPRTAPKVKTSAIESCGAELVLVDPTLSARLAAAAELVARHGYVLIPPFDDRKVIAGQGTIGLEIMADCPRADLVLVPVSGGGLISGIAAAVRASSPRTAVIGVEPELAADARDSFYRGEPVGWPPADVQRTIADALRVEQVGALPFAHIRELVTDIITVTEDEMVAAVRRLATQARLVAEPGGAAAVAAWLFRAGELPRAAAPVAVLSGGNIDPKLLAKILAADLPGWTPSELAAGASSRDSSYAGVVMRTTLAYSSARILLLVVAMILLYLLGARGLLLLALAFVVSGIASFVLLSKQRDVMSGALMGRLKNGRQRRPGLRARLEEGARAEDEE